MIYLRRLHRRYDLLRYRASYGYISNKTMKSFLNLTAPLLIFSFVPLLHEGGIRNKKLPFAYVVTRSLDIAMPDKKALTTDQSQTRLCSKPQQDSEISTLLNRSV